MLPEKCDNLRGKFVNQSGVALLLLDVLTDFDFPDGDILSQQATTLTATLPGLMRRARKSGVPVIYVNDNWGPWRSDRSQLLQHVLRPGSLGRDLVRLLCPQDQDYLVLKPKHSGFFGTTLELLLSKLGVKTLILTGLTGNVCVLFTAQDAYLRDNELIVPRDGLASLTPQLNEQALEHMRLVLQARTPFADKVEFESLVATLGQ